MMDFKAATANDWRYWPQREDVALRKQTAIGVYDTFPLQFTPGGAVKRRALTFKEMAASAGAYTSGDRSFLIPDVHLPDGVAPSPGDIIVDADEIAWTIGEVMVGKFGNTHKCISRALAIVENLKDVATLKRPVSAKDSAGRPALASTTTIAANIACRVQPEDSQSAEVFDRVVNPDNFTAYLSVPLDVQAHDQFVVGTTVYTVLGFNNPARIWDLMSLQLELLP